MSEKRLYEYSPCMKCRRHPRFPNTPPITLHIEGKCLLCKEQLESDLVDHVEESKSKRAAEQVLN